MSTLHIRFARRSINKRIADIRKVACPIKDAALLEFALLYEQAMGQLDGIADAHSSVVMDTDMLSETSSTLPALSDSKFRAEVARIMGMKA